jgi:glucose/arabinose dehydrogenase
LDSLIRGILALGPLLAGCEAPPTEVRFVDAFPGAERWIRPLWFGALEPGKPWHAVVEQRGLVYVVRIESNGTSGARSVFLDLSDAVRTRGNEQGLLGLAFHPRFATNGRFFVYYSADDADVKRLVELHASAGDPPRVSDTPARVLLEIPAPFDNHNGGEIRFGPDGMLYVGVGDGGAAGDPHDNAQDLRSLLGKILRIDVDQRPGQRAYAVPSDNPFVATPGARPEIWALGMRNPWRFCFAPTSGALWVGDVGQDRHEEVHVVERGGNYGWPLKEGFVDFRPNAKVRGPGELRDPVLTYPRSVGESITGGFVYRGTRAPTLAGAYVFADYASGRVFAVPADVERGREWRDIGAASGVSSFGEDAYGELYLCCFDGYVRRTESGPVTPARAADVPK